MFSFLQFSRSSVLHFSVVCLVYWFDIFCGFFFHCNQFYYFFWFCVLEFYRLTIFLIPFFSFNYGLSFIIMYIHPLFFFCCLHIWIYNDHFDCKSIYFLIFFVVIGGRRFLFSLVYCKYFYIVNNYI